jgi:hypothetical protein
MTYSWIIAQVLMVLYIRFASWHHAPAVNAMREYVPTPNPYEDPFHTNSWFQAAIVALSLSLGLLSYQHWSWCIVFGFNCAFLYWLLFDIWINRGTHKTWNYLGHDPSLDRWLRKLFGTRAGEMKAIILVVLIIISNILRFIL